MSQHCSNSQDFEYSTDPELHKDVKEPQVNKMEQTSIYCFQPDFTLDDLIKRQNLSGETIKQLNHYLHEFSNTKKFTYENILAFNKVSGLVVNFRYKNEFYSIEFKYDGNDVFFEASMRRFNKDKYDSDDEDEKDKMTSFKFSPFKRLFPVKQSDGSRKLTIDMYFNFVYDCLTMNPFYHEYAY